MQTQLQDPIHSYDINMTQSHHRLISGYSQSFERVELSTSRYPLETFPIPFQAFTQQQLGPAGERDIDLHQQYPVPQRSQLQNGSAASTSESDHTTAENLSEQAFTQQQLGPTGERDIDLHQQYPVPQRSQLQNGSAASTSDHTTAESLSEALGDLKIGETGVGACDLREISGLY
jgi:hypothetical protein